MIIESIFSFFAGGVIKLISLISIGTVSSDLMNKFYSVVDYLFDNLTLLGLFIRPKSMVSASILILAILNFEKIYRTAIWLKNRIKP